MLDYTIVAGKRVWQSIRRISLVFNLATQIVSMLVLLYITITKSGVLPLNITLLVLSLAYFIFYCVTVRDAKKNKQIRKRIKTFFKWSKRGIKLVNLGVMLYALISTKSPTALDIVLVCFSLGCWVLDILFEIAAKIVKGWGELMFEAVKADVETTIAPFTATKNFLRGLTGKEAPPPPPPPTKNRVMLDELVAKRKEESLRKKEARKIQLEELQKAKKIAVKELKQKQKADKKAEKLAKKQAKKAKPQPAEDEFWDETATTRL